MLESVSFPGVEHLFGYKSISISNRGRQGGNRSGDRRGITVFSGLPDCANSEDVSSLDLKMLFIPDIQFEQIPTPDKKEPQPMTGLAKELSEVGAFLLIV